jgi:carbonic anhydrase
LRIFLTFVLAVTAVAHSQQSTTPAAAAPTGAQWSYYGKRGPTNWGKLDPGYAACSKGKLESPIDIRNAKLDRALAPIALHYLSGPVTLFNEGHTIRGIVPAGNYIVFNGTRYDLQQFHFHHPAEHLVNGKLADLEIHLVHKSASGEFVVIAVLVKEGQVNGSLAALWPSLPRTVGASTTLQDPFDPAGLLPADQGYWAYTGSLTAPPCTEGVHWLIMENPTQLAGDQLDAFARLYPDNARPVEATRGRKVEASE